MTAVADANGGVPRSGGAMNLWWHCRFCGNHAPAQPTYEHGDKEICIKCGEGVAVVMTTREAAQFESEIARGERQPERCYVALCEASVAHLR